MDISRGKADKTNNTDTTVPQAPDSVHAVLPPQLEKTLNRGSPQEKDVPQPQHPPRASVPVKRKRPVGEMLSTEMPPQKKAVCDFMRQIRLEQYTDALLKKGYDDLDFMSGLAKEDLLSVGALADMLPGHVAKFVAAMTTKVNTGTFIGPLPTKVKIAPAAASAATPPKDQTAGLEDSYTVCVVDCSGSMQSMGHAVKDGFNEFIQEQKALPGKCMATVVRFAATVDTVHHGVDIADIPPATDATFAPQGRTALYDGIGIAIALVKNKILTLSSKPTRVMVMILTDGQENASRQFRPESVRETIKKCEKELNWEFVFIGANQNAIVTGKQMGFNAVQCLSYDPAPDMQRAAWTNISANMTRYRCGRASGWTKRERTTSSKNPKNWVGSSAHA